MIVPGGKLAEKLMVYQWEDPCKKNEVAERTIGS